MTARRIVLAVVIAAVVLAPGGCAPPRRSLLLGTTTSVDNSGLLHHFSPMFEKKTGIEIHALVVGSGKALKMAAEGKVDVVISHDPDAERAFVATGRAALYRQFMQNDFVIVGPPSNPAGILPADSPAAAFAKIHRSGSRFASRSDQSGTHTRELRLWKLAGVDPSGSPSYYPLGQSMAALLRSSAELRAYTLSDRATFEQLKGSVELRIFSHPDPLLINTYAVTLVRPTRPTPESRNAEIFVRWLLGEEGRRAIASYRPGGHQQFFLLPALPSSGPP